MSSDAMHVIGAIDPAVVQDVGLDPMQDRQCGKLLAHERDLVALPLEAVAIERAERRRVLGVIGDRDVLVSERAALGDHVMQCVAPVAVRGVHVQVAANVGALDEAGQRSRKRARRAGGESRSSGGT